MSERPEFRPLQAEEIARAFKREGVKASARGVQEGIFRVANLRDIIASKRASGRDKDKVELELLEDFRSEYEERHPVPLRWATELAKRKSRKAK